MPPMSNGFRRRASQSAANLLTRILRFSLTPTLVDLRNTLYAQPAKSLEDVLTEEWREIRMARELRKGNKAAYPEPAPFPGIKANPPLVGLALSGGGIRSATLNLGILQGLAKFGILDKLDYLSAVSGGNYIASWLGARIKREGLPKVKESLSPDRAGKPEKRESHALRWLREYGNYLTPRLGLLSGDTWTAISTYLRNLFLNQAILILVFCGLLMLPRVLTWISAQLGESKIPDLSGLPGRLNYVLEVAFGSGYLYFLAAVALLIYGVDAIRINMNWFAHAPEEDRTPIAEAGSSSANTTPPATIAFGTRSVWLNIVLPFVVASWLLTVWLWFGPASGHLPGLLKLHDGALTYAVVIAVLYALPWLFGVSTGTIFLSILGQPIPEGAWPKYAVPLFAVPAGGLGGVLLWVAGRIFREWKPFLGTDFDGGLWHGITWGPPMMLGLMALMAVLHIGLMGLVFQDGKREWWSRVGGAMLTAGLLWMTFFGVSLYGPLLLMWMGSKIAAGGLLGWMATTIGGVLGGKSARTNGKSSGKMLDWFLRIAPIVFIAGLMLLVSLGVHLVAVEYAAPDTKFTVIWDFFEKPATPPAIQVTQTPTSICINCLGPGTAPATPYRPTPAQQAAAVHWSLMNQSAGIKNFWELLVALLAAWILAARVDINEFSMHLFYRNRLARCYLGASRSPREANPFTGFSAADDLYLASLSNSPVVRAKRANWGDGFEDYAGPYPLVNTSLNVTTGQQLAWQERKARSFFFSPQYSGFEVLPEEQKGSSLQPQGYRETYAYAYSAFYGLGGPLVGTAMGISGAAASPNMGYHSSVPLAFLMTVFNVRLGWWMGNPRHSKTWTRPSPAMGLPYLFNELDGPTPSADMSISPMAVILKTWESTSSCAVAASTSSLAMPRRIPRSVLKTSATRSRSVAWILESTLTSTSPNSGPPGIPVSASNIVPLGRFTIAAPTRRKPMEPCSTSNLP